MNYHIPVTQNVSNSIPQFAEKNGEIVCPLKIYRKSQYPNMRCDMVKLTGMNGQNYYVPASKLNLNISSMDA